MADAGPPAPPALQVTQAPQALQALEQPLQPPVPNQPIPTQQMQHVPQLNWLHLNQNFQENQKKMQKHICLQQMVGLTHMHSQRVLRFNIFFLC